MGDLTVTREMLAAKFGAIFPHLDERQRRLLMGAEARALGHGGIRLVARAAWVREATVSLGIDELDAGVKVSNAQMAALPVSRHPFHGDWNYTLHPAGHTAAPPARSGQEHRPAALPELTGMTTDDLDELIAQLAALRQVQREQRARAHPASDA